MDAYHSDKRQASEDNYSAMEGKNQPGRARTGLRGVMREYLMAVPTIEETRFAEWCWYHSESLLRANGTFPKHRQKWIWIPCAPSAVRIT